MPEFDPQGFQPIWQLPFEGSWPTCVAIVGTRWLAAGNQDGELLVWELPQADQPEPPISPPVRKLIGHTNGISRLVALADGHTLVSASLDHSIRHWNLDAPATGSPVDVILDRDTRRREAKRTRDDSLLTAPGVSLPTQSATTTWDGHTDWIQALGISRDGRQIISGDDRGAVRVWDIARGEPVATWQGHPGNWIVSAVLDPEANRAFVGEYCHPRGSFDRPPAQARIYDVDAAEVAVDVLAVQFPDVKKRDNSYEYSSKWSKFVGRGFVAAAFSPHGRQVAVGQGGEIGSGKVHLLDAATGEVQRTVADHRYGVTDLLYSPDGKYLLSAGRDTTVQITQLESGEEAARLHEPRGGQFKDWLSAIALSAEGRWLAAADIAGMVHLWRA